jgi:transcriptional regulator with XRE-family HTH domain
MIPVYSKPLGLYMTNSEINNELKVTTFSTITLMLLKEVRLERGIHQAQTADMCDKTPSAWTKIETGRSPLTMEIFFRVCNGLHVAPSAVLATMDRYAVLLSQNGWGVISKELDFNEDLLLKDAQDYYASSGFRSRASIPTFGFNSVLNGPIYNPNGSITLAPVFWFALDPVFKSSQVNPLTNLY